MQTDFPTTTIYFVFALTYCKVRVYQEQEPFIRKVLEANNVEFLDKEASKDWHEWDTRVLLDRVCDALPKLFAKAGFTGALANTLARELAIKFSGR